VSGDAYRRFNLFRLPVFPGPACVNEATSGSYRGTSRTRRGAGTPTRVPSTCLAPLYARDTRAFNAWVDAPFEAERPAVRFAGSLEIGRTDREAA